MAVLLLAGCTPLPKKAAQRFLAHCPRSLGNVLKSLLLLTLLFLSLCLLVSSSYNPFLYFRF